MPGMHDNPGPRQQRLVHRVQLQRAARVYITATGRPRMNEPFGMLIAAQAMRSCSDSDVERPDASPDMHYDVRQADGAESSKRSLSDRMAPVVGIGRGASVVLRAVRHKATTAVGASAAKCKNESPTTPVWGLWCICCGPMRKPFFQRMRLRLQ